MKPIRSKEKKLLGKIYTYTPQKTKTTPLSAYVKAVTKTNLGYAGFSSRKYLRQRLEWENLTFEIIDFSRYYKTISRSIKKCQNALVSQRSVEIHLLPIRDDFVLDKMGGVSGYTPYRNVMLLLIDTRAIQLPGFKNTLEATIAHEYHHTVWSEKFDVNDYCTIRDSLVMEGLAEHFAEAITKRKTQIATTLDLVASKKLFQKIKNKLDDFDYNFYRFLFFGGKGFPIWAGYTIGYNLVASYLNQLKSTNWKDVTRTHPVDIIVKSDW